MTKIVMSYRREDTQAATHLMYERLQSQFGKKSVFLDFDSIGPGDDFREHINTVLHNCDIVLAMIGPRWHGPKAQRRSRLDDATDWVRIEIETALDSKIRIIPVLIDGTPMPKPEQLPESIRNLAYLNAIKIDTGEYFDIQMEKLVKSIGQHISRDDSQVKEGGDATGKAAKGREDKIDVSKLGLDAKPVTEPVKESPKAEPPIAEVAKAAATPVEHVAPPQPPKPKPIRGGNLTLPVDVTLEDAATGGTRHATLPSGGAIDVQIPAGVRDGETLLLRGQGKAGQFGGAAGDLLIRFKLVPHAVFARDGNNLKISVPVDAATAQMGGHVEVQTLSGSRFLAVPPGSVDGVVLRLEGDGLPARDTQAPGDLLVRLVVAAAPVAPPPPKVDAPKTDTPKSDAPGAMPRDTVTRDALAKDPAVPPPHNASVHTDVLKGSAAVTMPPKPRDGRIVLAVTGGVVLLLVVLWFALPTDTSTPTPLADMQSTTTPAGSLSALSESEKQAVQKADKSADDANEQARLADTAKEEALREAAKARGIVDSQPPRVGNDTVPASDQAAAITADWSYRGERAARDPNIIIGSGVKTWTVDASTCKPHQDASPPGRRYEGQLRLGYMQGLGAYYQCDGTQYFGWRNTDVAQGSGVSTRSDGITFRGRFYQGHAELGVKTYPPGSANVLSESGALDSQGRLEGPGVVVCGLSNGTRGQIWKGNWHAGILSGIAVAFDTAWNVVAHGNYGTAAGQTPPPDACGSAA